MSWKRTGAFVFFAILEASKSGETGCLIRPVFRFLLTVYEISISHGYLDIKKLSDDKKII
jgi:hypothetical protein